MFTKPAGKDVVCHASAWDVKYNNDLRIKMCIKMNQEDLLTIHHELGHDYYYHAYYKLPILYQDGANDGFHEAIGDAIALSMTPELPQGEGPARQGRQERQGDDQPADAGALDKIAFLPFGLLIDKWRWDVFSGKVKPDAVQPALVGPAAAVPGRRPAVERAATDFDPGAKYHVAAQRPVHALLPRRGPPVPVPPRAVQDGRLHRARSTSARSTATRTPARRQEDARARREQALARRPVELTGQREMDATRDPRVLRAAPGAGSSEQNKGQQCGW